MNKTLSLMMVGALAAGGLTGTAWGADLLSVYRDAVA